MPRKDKGSKRPHYNNTRRAKAKKSKGPGAHPPPDRRCPVCYRKRGARHFWTIHKRDPSVAVCSKTCANGMRFRCRVACFTTIGFGYGTVEKVENRIIYVRLDNGVLIPAKTVKRC